MIYRAYYLIRPAERLIVELNAFLDDSRILLYQSKLWINQEADSAWMPDDYVAQIKLLFLANLGQEYIDQSQSTPLSTFLIRLLDQPPWTTKLFDQWWTIERFTDVEIVEEVKQSLDTRAIEAITEIDHPLVESWLSKFVLKKLS
jgi:hypothetical protein